MTRVGVQLAGEFGADLLERVVRRGQLRVLADQRPELVLERVVLGVAERRLSGVVEPAVVAKILCELVDPVGDLGQRGHRPGL